MSVPVANGPFSVSATDLIRMEYAGVHKNHAGSCAVLRSGRVSSIDGTEIAFSEWGNARGPAVVLIHGWLFSRSAFERQLHGELADRCRLVAYDLRGHGESGKPDSLTAYSDSNVWAADLDCVLGAVAMPRAVLAGWSLGGRVAAHYVFVKGLERVSGLNLISARVLQPPGASVKRESSGPEMTTLSPAESTAATARFIRNCTRAPLSPNEEQSFLAGAMSVPPIARQGASAWHIDYGSFFDELKLPVLVTHGDSDALTVPAAAENIARRLRGKLSIHPDCGHMPFWENPGRFNHELAKFAEESQRR
jgi:non-heme chloroperoxidase